MSPDLLELCRGSHPGSDNPCPYFLAFSSECRVLRDEPMGAVFGQRRCRPEVMVETAVRHFLNGYSDRVDPSDFEEYLNSLPVFVMDQIQEVHLTKEYTIYALKAYINRTAYNRVVNTLQKDGILPQRTCGDCLHLSRSGPPYHCQRTTIEIEYSGEETPNLLYETPRKPSQRACSHGFEPYYLVDGPPEGEEVVNPGSDAVLKDLLETWYRCLEERIEQEAAGSKRREVCERQYLFFCNLVHYLEQGYSRTEAIRAIKALYGCNKKVLSRDFQEMREYLAKKNVL